MRVLFRSRYKLAPVMFGRMEKKLSSGLSADWQRPSLAPAFVLWAADWFRRSYQGGVQRWADIEKVLGLHLSQGDWRDLADQGFRAWGVERSEARRVGKECVRTGRSRWSPYH